MMKKTHTPECFKRIKPLKPVNKSAIPCNGCELVGECRNAFCINLQKKRKEAKP